MRSSRWSALWTSGGTPAATCDTSSSTRGMSSTPRTGRATTWRRSCTTCRRWMSGSDWGRPSTAGARGDLRCCARGLCVLSFCMRICSEQPVRQLTASGRVGGAGVPHDSTC